ncbi:MAG: metallophosphoesterase [Bacilli bacterium]|nr:metallophosphoesterase [Bacilli bacterium]
MKKRFFLAVLAIFNLLFYFSMRSFWSGIEDMFGIWWLAYLIFLVIIAIAVTAVILRLAKCKNSVLIWILLGLSIALTGSLGYMFYMGRGSLQYVIRTFCDALLCTAMVYLIWFMFFVYPKTKLVRYKLMKAPLFILVIILILIQIFDLRVNYFTYYPVVYAVEDEYQIVWSTNARSTGVVTVGNNNYYDLYAGSERSETRVHKVAVPMAVLDAAESYTIVSTTLIYRGPYSGVKGRTISKTYVFKPVDLSDGLNYYALSDTHEYEKAAGKAGAYWGDNLDFLVLIGDISSHLETSDDINLINKIAYNITKGEKPVVYAGGNHDVKAHLADQLYRYVGSKDEKFYYTFKLNGIYGIVMDLGEDHNDDWWEFYDFAHFDLYRAEQTAFLEQLLLSGEHTAPDVSYRMLISHIPVAYVQDDFLKDFKVEWTALLNQFELDIALSGHHHQLMPITTDIPHSVDLRFHAAYHQDTERVRGYRTDGNFNTFVVSRKSDVQDVAIPENLYGKRISGLAVKVNFIDNEQIVCYTNTKLEVVEVVNPFTGDLYKKLILPLE